MSLSETSRISENLTNWQTKNLITIQKYIMISLEVNKFAKHPGEVT